MFFVIRTPVLRTVVVSGFVSLHGGRGARSGRTCIDIHIGMYIKNLRMMKGVVQRMEKSDGKLAIVVLRSEKCEEKLQEFRGK